MYKRQDLDTGAKVVHAAPNTTSHISTKSIARDGGVSNFRSSVVVLPNAKGSKSSVSCESLMLDDRSRSDTIPAMDIRCDAVDVGHEAKIGRISEEAKMCIRDRGIQFVQVHRPITFLTFSRFSSRASTSSGVL